MPAKLITKQCPVCHKKFDTIKSQVTCSRSCSNTHFHVQRYTKLASQRKSQKLKGRKYPERRVLVTLTCPICTRTFDVLPCIAKTAKTCGNRECFRKRQSINLKGKTGGPRHGGGRGKQTLYGDVMWDSTWEARFAQRLDAINVKWIRPDKSQSIEYTTLDGKQRRYYPDVFLPDYDLFIEVKGVWTPEAHHKVKQAQLQKRIIVLETLDAIDNFHMDVV